MRKLLYVEDNEDNLYMLQLRFDVLVGYEVLSARDGAAGIADGGQRTTRSDPDGSELPEIQPAGRLRRISESLSSSCNISRTTALCSPCVAHQQLSLQCWVMRVFQFVTLFKLYSFNRKDSGRPAAINRWVCR